MLKAEKKQWIQNLPLKAVGDNHVQEILQNLKEKRAFPKIKSYSQ